jgi:hypothetical protein
MRMIVSWDGSGHAIEALRGVIGLFRDQSIEHVEIILTVWPPREIAMWADIQEKQFVSDDLHSAAAQVAADNIRLLEDMFRPLSQSIASSTTNGPFAGIINGAIEKTKADVLFVVAGARDPHNAVQETMRAVVIASKIPTWILRPPGNATT